MNIKTLAAGTAVLAVLAAVGYGFYSHKTDNVADIAPAAGAPAEQGGMPVEAATVKTGAVERTIEAVGTLNSNESVIIRPEINGRIESITFEEGQPVEEGQELIKIDDATYRAALAEAQANLALSRANFKRAEDLFAKRTGSERTLDEARARRDADSAAVALAKANLEKMSLRAPFDGYIGLRRVSIGDYVTPGQDLVNLEDISTLKVDFRVPELFLSQIEVGQQIIMNVDALPGEDIRGKVYAIDPRVDAAGRSLLVRATVDNADNRLRPGLFARVHLVVEENNNALLIPEQALMPQGDKQFVYKITDGKVDMVPVKTGLRRRSMVEITDGLSAGDQVVTAGQMKIQPGAAVTVVPGEEAEQTQ